MEAHVVGRRATPSRLRAAPPGIHAGERRSRRKQTTGGGTTRADR